MKFANTLRNAGTRLTVNTFSYHALSVVCPSFVPPSVCKLFTFNFFSRTTGTNATKLGSKHAYGKGILSC